MMQIFHLRPMAAVWVVLFAAAFCGCKPKDAQPTISPEDIVVVEPKTAGADGALVTELVGVEAFETFVKSAPVTLVDFSATWCGPCQKLAPQIDKMAESYGKDGVKFAKADADANQTLCDKLGVNGIPDVRVFVNGVQFAQTVGAIPVEIMTNLENALKAAAEQPAPAADAAATETPVEQAAPAAVAEQPAP